jgi:hypothetical protein
VTPVAVPHGTVGSAYSQTLNASGGVAPYSCPVPARCQERHQRQGSSPLP